MGGEEVLRSGRTTANTINEQMPKNHDGVVEELD